MKTHTAVMGAGERIEGYRFQQDIEQKCRKYFKENGRMIDGQEMTRGLGNERAVKFVIMIAFLSVYLELQETQWIEALKPLPAAKFHYLDLETPMKGEKL